MDSNNYLGSFAQENVVFQTVVSETSSYGENMQRVMLFADYANIADTSALTDVDGSTTIKAAIVTADTYASVVSGLAQSWLTDLFANGTTQQAYVVVCGTGAADLTVANVTRAYELLKAYAYWKVVCPTVLADSEADPAVEADPSALDSTRLAELASALADLCNTDKQVLSGPIPVPLTLADPAGYETDPVYVACAGKYVFMSYHQDATRNAALYSIGLALSTFNDSGTSVGNSLDMAKSNSITSNGLSQTLRTTLEAAYIQTWKPVGDNSSYVAAKGDKTLSGETIGANWIVAFVTYMSKVEIAVMMTVPNFYKNNTNYQKILAVLSNQLNKFAGRITGISITAPSYGALPSAASDELVIPNAWEATYVDHLRKITITGTLYVGE